MRILTALTYYRPHYSGLTIYAERVARDMAARGHQVTVLTSRYDKKLPPHEMLRGVQVIRPTVFLRISKGVIMPAILLRAWQLGRQADIIHVHLPQLDAAPIAVIARLLHKPLVVTYHCDMVLPKGAVHRLANWVSDIANHITVRLAKAVVHNTQDYAVHSPFLKQYLSRVQAIQPPIEMAAPTIQANASFQKKANIQPGQRIIGIAARLATEKGVEYLAKAMPSVLQKHPTARVLMVGPYQRIVGEEAYARRLAPLLDSLGNHWTFLGVLDNGEHAAFFQHCEVTVLPSINSTESYGMVQVESMQCGTPVIASDRPGMRVPVQMTGMGNLFPPGDVQALAQALIDFLDHPGAYRGDSQAWLEASTAQAVAARYEALFESLRQPRHP